MPDDDERNDNQASASVTRGERVRAAARTLQTPRTATQISDETEVSVKTAQKYLEQLVEDNVLRKVERANQTLYSVDRLVAAYREVAALQREHDRAALNEYDWASEQDALSA